MRGENFKENEELICMGNLILRAQGNCASFGNLVANLNLKEGSSGGSDVRYFASAWKLITWTVLFLTPRSKEKIITNLK
jgi:hypothetical protein